MQQFQLVFIKQETIWESITLVVTFDLLHNDSKITTAFLFYFGGKDLEKIQ